MLRTSTSLALVALSLFAAAPAFAQEQPATPTPATAPAPSTPPPVASAMPTQTSGGHVTASVEAGTSPAVVERLTTTDETDGRAAILLPLHTITERWEQVCVAPCKVDLDRASSYRIANKNHVAESGSFTLPQAKDQLRIQVEPGSSAGHRVGGRLIALGVAAAIVGGILIGVASSYDDKDDEKNARLGGIITSGSGILLMGIGIPLYIATATHVSADGNRVVQNQPRFGGGGFRF